jgi:hypothetical protein
VQQHVGIKDIKLGCAHWRFLLQQKGIDDQLTDNFKLIDAFAFGKYVLLIG